MEEMEKCPGKILSKFLSCWLENNGGRLTAQLHSRISVEICHCWLGENQEEAD